MTNTTKERPILFNGKMVRAILDGRKTQTRRVLDPQPEYTASDEVVVFADGSRSICPFGQPGDRLWVRETWTTRYCTQEEDGVQGDVPVFRADYEYDSSEVCWTPSIHMPRWACRLVLEVTDLRVERLQEISEEDAKAEGSAFTCNQCGNDLDSEEGAEVHWMCDVLDEESFVYGFKRIWNSCTPKKPWDSNPWVWVVTFKRLEQAQ